MKLYTSDSFSDYELKHKKASYLTSSYSFPNIVNDNISPPHILAECSS